VKYDFHGLKELRNFVTELKRFTRLVSSCNEFVIIVFFCFFVSAFSTFITSRDLVISFE